MLHPTPQSFIILASLWLTACVFQAPESQPDAKNHTRFTVEGKLYKSITSATAASGYQVELVGAGTQQTQTAADGKFYFTEVASGAYKIKSLVGVTGSESYGVEVTDLVVIESDISLGDLVLPGVLKGNAKLAGASDHSGIDVFVPGSAWIAKTDASGEYLISGLPDGNYQLRFSKKDYDEVQLDAVRIIGGEVKVADSVELALDGASGAVLTGKIVLVGRASSAGAVVKLDGTSYQAITAADGSFAMQGITTGEYAVVITAPAGWITEIRLPNLPLMPGNPVALPELALGRGTVVSEGFLQDVSADGKYAVACDSQGEAAYLLRLDFSDEIALFPGCFDLWKIAIGESVAFIADGMGGSVFRYNLATKEQTIPYGGVGNIPNVLARGDSAVVLEGYFDENSSAYRERYYRMGTTGNAVVFKEAEDFNPSGLMYMSPRGDYVLVETGVRYEGGFPVATTYSAMALADGALTEVGELAPVWFGESEDGVYFIGGARDAIVRVDFADWSTSTVIADLPSFNNDFLDSYFSGNAYPLDFSADTGRFAYIGDDGLYAGSVTLGTVFRVVTLSSPVDCIDGFCAVTFFPGGESVAGGAGVESYQGPVLAPASEPSPANLILWGSTPSGTFAFTDVTGLRYQTAGNDSVAVAGAEYSGVYVKANSLFYTQRLSVTLDSPLYSHSLSYIVQLPLP